MRVRTLSGALVALVCFSTAAAETPVWGPTANPADQYRFFWLLADSAYPKCRDAGFNLIINPTRASGYWAMPDGKRAEYNADAQHFAYARRVAADGVDRVEKLSLNACGPIKKMYAQVRRDGTKNVRSFDLNDPAMQQVVTSRFTEAAMSVKDLPGIVGVHAASEVRDGSIPSFSPGYRARCLRDLGYPMPENITSSRLTLKACPDVPVNGVVASNYRPLEYLAWFWRRGDGWNDYQTDVPNIYRDVTGKRLFSYFDPVVRAPPLWGMGGNKLDFGGQWYYAVPQPYGISFCASELQSMARGTPGMGVFLFPSGILAKRWAMPEKAKVTEQANPTFYAAWKDKKVRYITMPPDMMRGAIWTLFSRKLDGIGTYACNALFPEAMSGNSFTCTDSTTFEAIRDAFQRVGVKLGPLLRAVPEREPEVAFLESYASSILAGAGSMGWQYNYGELMVAANLVPYVIYEEEIAQRGIPSSVKVIVMPDAPVITEPTFAALRVFQAKGGVLASDRKSVPALLPDVTMPDYLLARGDRAMNAVADREVMHRAAPELRAALASVVTPYADSDNADIRVHARSYRQADYVFAVNDKRAFGETVGHWKRVPEKGLPNAGTVTVRRAAGAVYDLEKEQPVPFTVADGITRIDVNYTTTDGRILLVTPRPLAALGVTVDGGELIVRTPDDDVMVPIAMTADGEKPVYGVVEAGVWRHAVPKGANVRIRNLADGQVYAVGAKMGVRNAETGKQAAANAQPAKSDECIAARQKMRAALEKGVVPDEALHASDASVRRYALLKLAEQDSARARQVAQQFVTDSHVSVRLFAKKLVQTAQNGEQHEARSLSPLNDHETVVVAAAKVEAKGGFTFPADLKGHEAIELWFGKPKTDLAVWLNGTYLGSFDSDADAGTEFRLDATKETKLGAANELVVKNLQGEIQRVKGVRAVAVKW